MTPDTSSAVSIGTAKIDFGMYPVASAASRSNRGSRSTSCTAIACPDATTYPAMPRFTGRRIPITLAAAEPVAASKTSSRGVGVEDGDGARPCPERDLRCLADGLEDLVVIDRREGHAEVGARGGRDLAGRRAAWSQRQHRITAGRATANGTSTARPSGGRGGAKEAGNVPT